MAIKGKIRANVNSVLRRFGAEIVPTRILYDWQRARGVHRACHAKHDLPAGAAQYLRPNNPRLEELRRRYAACDPQVVTPFVWTQNYVTSEDVASFRGDNGWVWQVRGSNSNILGYALSFYYLKSMDRLGLLEKLSEDHSFGNFTFAIGGRLVSRDLLDSVAEIYFLDRHLGIFSARRLTVLDVGAGYGRLAHRMTSAVPGIERYFCTDAVAVSTFLCEYYLRYRNLAKAQILPLDELDATLSCHPVDLAVNIHSFSECRFEAIEWWARLLSKYRVRNLMVVPNRSSSGGERLQTNDGRDFLPLLEQYGYHTIVKEPKFLDPVAQEYGLSPTWHHLLELQR